MSCLPNEVWYLVVKKLKCIEFLTFQLFQNDFTSFVLTKLITKKIKTLKANNSYDRDYFLGNLEDTLKSLPNDIEESFIKNNYRI